jgi:lysophospholipase L1-like esterase
MDFVKYWAMRAGLAGTIAMLAVAAACSKTPTAPTPPPPPPPPVANPPSLSCISGLARSTTNAGGLAITFETPAATDGQGTVNVTCDPSPGANFPIGTTTVSCTATDTLNRTATCSFAVNVSKLPTLSKTRFLAFGDSVTAGEVTFPIGGSLFGANRVTKQVVVTSASYPTVLTRTLVGRYAAQAATINVWNYGFGGEKAINARTRFISALNAVNPEAVLLMEGYNDIGGGLDGAASGAASEMRAMAAEARLRGMRVFLATLAPPRLSGTKPIGQLYIDDYNNRMRDLAAREGAVLVDIYAGLLPDVTRYIGVDGLHPTEAGYAKIADVFFQAIQNTFEVK